MKASKAPKAPKGKKAEAGEVRTVTFRLTTKDHKALVDYALGLGMELGKRVSNTEALRHMLSAVKAPSPRRRASEAAPAAQ